MTRFLAIRNKDQQDAYISALLTAGFQETKDFQDADLLLTDWERTGATKTRILQYTQTGKPVFVYPHTPYAYFIWDGLQEMPRVTCQFVTAPGPKMGLQSFGYPYRVEVVGFHCGPVRPFKPTAGRRVLFVPAHPLSDGRYSSPETARETQRAYEWILDNRDEFETVTVHCLRGTLEEYTGLRYVYFDAYTALEPGSQALFSIENADLVIGVGTFAYIAVAAGVPTVMYGHETPSNRLGRAQHYELYRSHFEFPLLLERMSMAQVVAACESERSELLCWKALNIGELLDAGKFVSILREYVS